MLSTAPRSIYEPARTIDFLPDSAGIRPFACGSLGWGPKDGEIGFSCFGSDVFVGEASLKEIRSRNWI